jgi:hypothetical protein
MEKHAGRSLITEGTTRYERCIQHGLKKLSAVEGFGRVKKTQIRNHFAKSAIEGGL